MLEPSILVAMITAFIIAVILSPIFIPYLRKLKFGQSIRDEGPQSHKKKSGTPTMGGIIILIALSLSALLISMYFDVLSTRTYVLLFVTICFGVIGFLDDYIKVVKKRNLGLTSKQKFICQVIVSIIVFFAIRAMGVSTSISIPGTNYSFDLGFIYVLLIIFMLVGTSNAVNLTDGLDGLVSGTAAIAFGAYAVLAYNQHQLDVAIFSIAVVGAVLGFLVFNAHPAKVFMGDTGSLALGGALAAIAIVTHLEILLVVIGGIFVIETLSVMIQVASFKATGKRVFKMSPLHHHYELSGWTEWRVVVTFWFVGLLFALLGIYIEVWM
ncbi:MULTISPECIES: phospho-N-acetylmuramoyl-pentapeptide-transferase [unclassified Bacillus (in: firmicutes)]|uniref:phospho-N-acetylmuramoyl-pentapeptide- transferase n=1 Tax=unclassified Bacillus (in: firmicutes) TaxID=185979 RepID=UPI000BEF7798|nr:MULTISPECIES: phospho-N-acetylmuramoyl-pentapeptide-transferase [unclassified Bacillus (in: firmicutes)]PEJ60324.1 phospho-N-acetylmuramoyl-pentapeptide-transferase [Bacillus sp. AFS002410]PEL10664.1 phospho-N-acetylmuramoyl-pentapeptide-transferase [Bacillus sp. AFS017336]